jgi:hypothetical protein
MYHVTDLGKQNPHCTARYHGTYSAYRYGCRCPHAREAKRLYDKRGRCGTRPQTLLPVTGTARRIRALAAIGWPYHQLATRLDCSWQAVQQLALEANPLVHHLTANKVAAVYRTLCVTPGPSNRTRRQAKVKGWHTPIAWDNIDDPAATPSVDCDLAQVVDDVLVQRAVDGNPEAVAALNPLERVEATRRLLRRGVTPGAVSRRLKVSGATAIRLVTQAAEAVAA